MPKDCFTFDGNIAYFDAQYRVSTLSAASIIRLSRWQSATCSVQQTTKARWLQFCAEAAICEDRERLLELAAEIMLILHEEERRLENHRNGLRR